MSRQRVARNAAWSVAQVVLSAAALLATYWLMLRVLSVEEIGLWALVLGSTLVARLSELGLGAGVLRFVARDLGAGDARLAARTVGMTALLVTALVGALAAVLEPVLLAYLLRLSPPALHGAVAALVPAALGGVVFGAAGNVFLSAIDGTQRMDLRAGLQVAGSLVQLGTTWFVLPRWGVAGLGLVQLAQSGFLLIAGMIGAVWLIGRPLRDYLAFDRARLRELFVYGGGLQVSAIAQLLLEPLLKVLLATFSGLTLTGYFDMANRIVLQFRSVIVAAYAALVPHVATQSGAGTIGLERMRAIYREAFGVLLFALMPYFACVAAGLPLALTLWKGQFDRVFLSVALLQFAAWFLNALTAPAYLLYVGVGRLRWTILSHVVIAAITLGLGIPLGLLRGGTGVLIAGALALVGGSLLVPIMFQREYGLILRELLPRERWPGLALVPLALAASAALAMWTAAPSWTVLLGLPLVTALLAAVVAWRDPLRPHVVGLAAPNRT